MTIITMNKEKNGIEVRFAIKPDSSVLETLKANGFRWSGKQKMWYAKHTDERFEIVKGFGEVSISDKTSAKKTEIVDLWELTRVDDIENHYETLHITDTKEIAAIIRKHLRSRFPMCKWSVRSDYNSIDVNLLVSPYAIDSDILKAIVHYAYKYAQSYNYDNSDSYSDYYDVNFYGVYEQNIVSRYDYEQREATVGEENAEQDFAEKKAAFDKAEIERKEREYQEYLETQREKEEEYKRQQVIRKSNHEKIMAGVKVKDVTPYYVLDCDSTNASKEDTADGYFDDCDGDLPVEHRRQNCRVTREVYMSAETYELFKNQLLDDYDFLDGKGGTATDDFRINAMEDYRRMSELERKTVEWYIDNAVAIYVNGKLTIIIDPEGYSYARYVYFVDEKTRNGNELETTQAISKAEAEEYKIEADALEFASKEVIEREKIDITWSSLQFDRYKTAMTKYIRENEIPFSINSVRMLPEGKLKTAMYRLLNEPESAQTQIERCGLLPNQKITIVKISEFGGISVQCGLFCGYTIGKYAQYDNIVKLFFKPRNSRKERTMMLYSEVLIYNGWLEEFPEELFYKIEHKESDGFLVTTKMTLFSSFDRGQYDVAILHYKKQGHRPIINTYKPIFD